jgi:hypothetical protein
LSSCCVERKLLKEFKQAEDTDLSVQAVELEKWGDEHFIDP